MTTRKSKRISLTEGLALIHEYSSEASGRMCFALLMENSDKSYSFYRRDNQPCYGELREYSTEESRPSDLRSPFPSGRPTALSVPMFHRANDNIMIMLGSLDYAAFICSQESPYKAAFKDCQIINNAFVFENLRIPPTVLVSGLLAHKNMYDFTAVRRTGQQYTTNQRFMNLFGLCYSTHPSGAWFKKNPEYFMNKHTDIQRYLYGIHKPEGTLEDRTPYDRDTLDKCFGEVPRDYPGFNPFTFLKGYKPLSTPDIAVFYQNLMTDYK